MFIKQVHAFKQGNTYIIIIYRLIIYEYVSNLLSTVQIYQINKTIQVTNPPYKGSLRSQVLGEDNIYPLKTSVSNPPSFRSICKYLLQPPCRMQVQAPEYLMRDQ